MEENDRTSRWTTARVIEPAASGYLLVAVRTGPWPLPLPLPRRRRRRTLALLRTAATGLRGGDGVTDVTVLRGLVRPPGRMDAPSDPRPLDAAYDAVLLVTTVDPRTAERLASGPVVAGLVDDLDDPLLFVGRNVRRLGPVDHGRPGVFLLNYFSAGDPEATLAAWQYTAGWFQEETGLDNSTVIAPVAGSDVPYTHVNHARWDRLRDVLPDLVVKRSFRTFVLREFARHGVAPHPVLYRLAR